MELTWSRYADGEGSVKASWKEDAWVIREVCGEKISLGSSAEAWCCCGEAVNAQLCRGQACDCAKIPVHV